MHGKLLRFKYVENHSLYISRFRFKLNRHEWMLDLWVLTWRGCYKSCKISMHKICYSEQFWDADDPANVMGMFQIITNLETFISETLNGCDWWMRWIIMIKRERKSCNLVGPSAKLSLYYISLKGALDN